MNSDLLELQRFYNIRTRIFFQKGLSDDLCTP